MNQRFRVAAAALRSLLNQLDRSGLKGRRETGRSCDEIQVQDVIDRCVQTCDNRTIRHVDSTKHSIRDDAGVYRVIEAVSASR